jgi:hypothetical protein
MIAIKFSHVYYKMPEEVDGSPTTQAKLMQIFVCDAKDLSDIFIRYDTAYYDTGCIGYYELPKGKVIVIILNSGNEWTGYKTWTTIRRWTPAKEEYYSKHVGEDVSIVIEEANQK